MKNKLDKVEAIVKELLKQMSVEAKITIEEDKENEVVLLDLQSEDNALLVGYHGKNLAAFQIILGLLIHKKLGEWVHLVVDIDNYRQKRESQLEEMAMRAVEQAGSTGQSIAIADLTPGERRYVHILLDSNKQVETYSEGEGRNRQLIIKLID